MTFLSLFLTIYFVTVIVAVVMTFREQRKRGHVTPMFTILGYILCIVWPLVAASMMAFQRLATQEVKTSPAGSKMQRSGTANT